MIWWKMGTVLKSINIVKLKSDRNAQKKFVLNLKELSTFIPNRWINSIKNDNMCTWNFLRNFMMNTNIFFLIYYYYYYLTFYRLPVPVMEGDLSISSRAPLPQSHPHPYPFFSYLIGSPPQPLGTKIFPVHCLAKSKALAEINWLIIRGNCKINEVHTINQPKVTNYQLH